LAATKRDLCKKLSLTFMGSCIVVIF
jgi:hypothetical protein